MSAQASCVQVRRARRFFPEEAAAEIWAEVQPAFDDLASNACLEGLGFLVQFIPTVALQRISSADSAAAAQWRGCGRASPLKLTHLAWVVYSVHAAAVEVAAPMGPVGGLLLSSRVSTT